MLQQKRVPKVLFIRNVFLHDCLNIDHSLESKLLTEKPVNTKEINLVPNKLMDLTTYSVDKEYQKIPKVFESIETWPKSTNLHCWYCTNQFNGIPKALPLVVEPNIHSKNNDKYLIEVESNCCRWPCCISYIKETSKDITKTIEKINNLYFFIKLWTGKYPTHIPSAPNKFLQKKFGGELTTEQYYKLYDEIEEQNLI
jgi:hypothetical protein